MNILIPKYRYSIEHFDAPVFFLLGPVRGGGDWQKRACELLQNKLKGPFSVAIPYYHRTEHRFPLWVNAHALAERGGIADCQVDGSVFERQLDWERHYIKQAAQKANNGCLIVWLPTEDPTDRRPPEEGPYARDTRGEVGRYCALNALDWNFRMAIGGEEEFHGIDLIERNAQQDLIDANRHPEELRFRWSLDNVIQDAVNIATDVI